MRDANEYGFEYHNIPLDGFLTGIRAHALMRIVETIRMSPKPMLVHCLKGSDRTGAVVAAYRIMLENWSADDAISEMVGPDYGWSGLPGGNIVIEQLRIIKHFMFN
jgi:protein-tyrosine phosphatase